MNLKIRFPNSDVPGWCADLDDKNLKSVWERDGAIHSIDTMSAFPLKKGLLKNSKHIFRCKWLNPEGIYFYFLLVEDNVSKVNPSNLKLEMVPGVQILNVVMIKNNHLEEIAWPSPSSPFQGSDDPRYVLAKAAKKYEQKTAPYYMNFVV